MLKEKQATKLLTEPFVQNKIIQYLQLQGWSGNLQSANLGQTGVDVKVKNDKVSRYWLVEVKGDPSIKVKSPSGSRSSNLNSALGQIISRMHTNRKRGNKYGYKYGIAFPMSYKNMVLKKLPYDVCDKLNLYAFFVNAHGNVEEFNHRQIKIIQTKK